MKKSIVLLTGACAMLIAGCSTPPPQPPRATGALIPANAGDESIQELVRVAVAAANPKEHRFTAQRGEKLKQVLGRWAHASRSKLVIQTEFNPTLIGGINEADLHGAVVALSVLLQQAPDGAVVDLSTPGVVLIKNLSTEK